MNDSLNHEVESMFYRYRCRNSPSPRKRIVSHTEAYGTADHLFSIMIERTVGAGTTFSLRKKQGLEVL